MLGPKDVSEGTIVAGGTVRRSVVSANVRVEPRALVEGSVLLSGVRVGEGPAKPLGRRQLRGRPEIALMAPVRWRKP